MGGEGKEEAAAIGGGGGGEKVAVVWCLLRRPTGLVWSKLEVLVAGLGVVYKHPTCFSLNLRYYYFFIYSFLGQSPKYS